MRSTVDLLPHDLAVITALETIAGSHPVGFAAAPEGAYEAVRLRTGPDYMVLFPLNSLRDGSLGDPWTDADLTYQVTCVGRLADGVRWLVDQIEPALLGITVSGRYITQVIPDEGGPVRPELDVEPAVFLATPRYTLQSLPT